MQPADAPLVSIRNVGKTFEGGVTALDDVSLDIAQGSFTSLIGASGCGKSTLLRLVSGLVSPTTGAIESEGFRKPGALGFVFQEPTLMPWATVENNVALPLQLLGVQESERGSRIDAALGLVGLSDFRAAYPRTLSGGMKMRVSIARALVSRPSLLLLDEPFAALDEFTRERLNKDLLKIWREQNLTVLFVTHSVFESVYLSTRIVVMSPRPGRIVSSFSVNKPSEVNEEWRLTTQYTEQCGEVSRTLKGTMEASSD